MFTKVKSSRLSINQAAVQSGLLLATNIHDEYCTCEKSEPLQNKKHKTVDPIKTTLHPFSSTMQAIRI